MTDARRRRIAILWAVGVLVLATLLVVVLSEGPQDAPRSTVDVDRGGATVPRPGLRGGQALKNGAASNADDDSSTEQSGGGSPLSIRLEVVSPELPAGEPVEVRLLRRDGMPRYYSMRADEVIVTGRVGQSVHVELPEAWFAGEIFALASRGSPALAGHRVFQPVPGASLRIRLEVAARVACHVVIPTTLDTSAVFVSVGGTALRGVPGRLYQTLDARGEATFTLPPGYYFISAGTAADYATSKVWRGYCLIKPDGGATSIDLELGPRFEVIPVRFRYEGREQDWLEAGSVVQVNSGTGRLLLPSVVGPDGVAQLRGVIPQQSVTVMVYPGRAANGSWRNRALRADLKAGELRPGHVFVVGRAGNVAFHVRHADEAADVSGLRLRLEPIDRSGRKPTGETDTAGMWRPFADGPQPPGRYRLVHSSGEQLWEGTIDEAHRTVDVAWRGGTPETIALVDWNGDTVTSQYVHVGVLPASKVERLRAAPITSRPPGFVTLGSPETRVYRAPSVDRAKPTLVVVEAFAQVHEIPLTSPPGGHRIPLSDEVGCLRLSIERPPAAARSSGGFTLTRTSPGLGGPYRVSIKADARETSFVAVRAGHYELTWRAHAAKPEDRKLAKDIHVHGGQWTTHTVDLGR